MCACVIGAFLVSNAVVFDPIRQIRTDRFGEAYYLLVISAMLCAPITVFAPTKADRTTLGAVFAFGIVITIATGIDPSGYSLKEFVQHTVALLSSIAWLSAAAHLAKDDKTRQALTIVAVATAAVMLPAGIYAASSIGIPLVALRPYANHTQILFAAAALASLRVRTSPLGARALILAVLAWGAIGGSRVLTATALILLITTSRPKIALSVAVTATVVAIGVGALLGIDLYEVGSVVFGNPSLGTARFSSLTSTTRPDIWAQALDAIVDAPTLTLLIGYGHRGIAFIDSLPQSTDAFYLAHNTLLNAAVYGGLIGVWLFTLFFFRVSTLLVRNYGYRGWGILAGLFLLGLMGDLPWFGPGYDRFADSAALSLLIGTSCALIQWDS